MVPHDQNDPKLNRMMYHTMKCIDMEEIPLLIAIEQDQWAFVQWASSVLRGKVVYSTAPDATHQILKSIESFDYLFLIIEDRLTGDVNKLVRYYLESRDVARWGGTVDATLLAKFREVTIHPDHRLILLIGSEVLDSEPSAVERYFRKLCPTLWVS